MPVMLDTNVIISAIFFPSAQTRLLVKLLENHQIVLCDYVVKELEIVVARKFSSKVKDLQLFLKELPFELINTPKIINIKNAPNIRDLKDIPILVTAINEKVDIFITGDKDFLDSDIDTPQVLTMTQFLEIIHK